MPEEVRTESQPIPAAEAKLLAGTERRIQRAMWVLGALGTALCWLWRGWGWGAGFAIGAFLSALNFRWMKSAVHALADAASEPFSSSATGSATGPAFLPGNAASTTEEVSEQTAPATARDRRPRGVWGRFVFRYALIGLAGYAIFKSSFVSLGAFFLGLFLFIAAILAEIVYQVYCAFRGE